MPGSVWVTLRLVLRQARAGPAGSLEANASPRLSVTTQKLVDRQEAAINALDVSLTCFQGLRLAAGVVENAMTPVSSAPRQKRAVGHERESRPSRLTRFQDLALVGVRDIETAPWAAKQSDAAGQVTLLKESSKPPSRH